MRNQTPLSVMWRRKGVILATFLTFVVVTAVVSKTLDKVYSTHATLFVALAADQQTFDSVQASQAVARSYADIIDSPNIAQRVAVRMGGGTTRKEVLDASSFETVVDTQLLQITAEDNDPDRAKLIADTYAAVFTQYARENLAQETKATISVADPAPRPTSAARPKPTLYTLIAAIFGLALGIALAFLRERIDHRLRSSEDVELRFDRPVLGRVPRRGRSDASVTAFREAFRILRTNLQFAARGAPLRSIAITSGSEGEGKTTTAVQLALATAELGQSVILVEADFRRPRLQEELLPDRSEPLRPGLSNFIVEAAELDDVVYPTARPNIDLVPSGPLPPSPSALLESRRARGLIGSLLDRADFVIVDCPPLAIGADASVISSWVDGVVVVVDLASSTDRMVLAGVRQLDAVQADTLGLVLNRDREAEPTSYGYYMDDAIRPTAPTASR
jgi:capsular exopolysaccharide synthesis family protein